MWIYTTPVDAQNKVNVICFALLCPSRKRFAGSKNRQFWVHRAVPLTD